MSSLLRRSGVLLLLLLPQQARSQEVVALERRLRVLAELQRTAAAAAQAESTKGEALDTFRVGALVVLGRPSDAGLILPATAIAWGRLDSLYGDAAAALAVAPMVFFRQGNPIREKSAREHARRVMAAPDATPADAAFQLVRAGSAELLARTDTAFSNWLGPQLLADISPQALDAHAYVELVTVPSQAVRRCYGGAVDACSAALGIAGDTLIPVWYNANERRALVKQSDASHPERTRCVESGDDAACLDVLTSLRISPPLSNDVRQSLVRVVTEAGGRHAFARLSQGAGQSLERRLALAAQLPLDSLLHRWRDGVIVARPHPVTLLPANGWMALGWCIVFGLLALRSTRWR